MVSLRHILQITLFISCYFRDFFAYQCSVVNTRYFEIGNRFWAHQNWCPNLNLVIEYNKKKPETVFVRLNQRQYTGLFKTKVIFSHLHSLITTHLIH